MSGKGVLGMGKKGRLLLGKPLALDWSIKLSMQKQ